MKKLLSGFVFSTSLASVFTLHAQVAPSLEWQKCLGGNSYDSANSIQQTSDGGFIVTGLTFSNDGNISGNHGNDDWWIMKLNNYGNLIWQKCLGGSDYDGAYFIQQTDDGGFIAAGFSRSTDGNVSENHGLIDDWVVKLDSDGNLVWQKSLGGSSNDEAYYVQQTNDNGFIVAGYSNSNDGDVSGNHGGYDYWIVKLDADGNLVWQKSLGGSNDDEAHSIQQTTDGGYVVAGYSTSNDDNVSGNHGGYDYWIVKLDGDGNLGWQQSLGGSSGDVANSIHQTNDGGFIIAGYSGSLDYDVSVNYGGADYWIVKLDSAGNLVWQKSFGGSNNDLAWAMDQTADGGFIVAGDSQSNDGNVSGNHPYYYYNYPSDDYWVVKLDSIGNLIWQKCLGGEWNDAGLSVSQTNDAGYIVAGYSESNDGDVSGNHGNGDCWLVKLSSEIPTAIPSPSTNFISLHPNPAQTQLIINLATPTNETIICVYDLQGKIIQLPTTFTNTQAQLNITSLPNGFYTLQIINNKTGENEVGKFVKANR